MRLAAHFTFRRFAPPSLEKGRLTMWRFARFYKNARSATTQAFFIGDDLPVDGRQCLRRRRMMGRECEMSRSDTICGEAATSRAFLIGGRCLRRRRMMGRECEMSRSDTSHLYLKSHFSYLFHKVTPRMHQCTNFFNIYTKKEKQQWTKRKYIKSRR